MNKSRSQFQFNKLSYIFDCVFLAHLVNVCVCIDVSSFDNLTYFRQSVGKGGFFCGHCFQSFGPLPDLPSHLHLVRADKRMTLPLLCRMLN